MLEQGAEGLGVTVAVRNVPAIAGGMVSQLLAMIDGLTDVSEGAVARSILESAAIEILRLEVFAAQGVREGIETGTYRHFNFYRLPASYASGFVRYSRTSSTTALAIPLGHRTRVPGSAERVYATLLGGALPIGATTIDLPVRCVTAGQPGNTAAHTIVELADAFNEQIDVTNPAAILNGQDRESESSRFDRFSLFVAGLSRATAVSLEEAATRVARLDEAGNVIERVASVHIHEPWQDSPRGHVGVAEVYVDNGSGSATADLLAEVRRTLLGYVDADGVKHPGYGAAGVDQLVFAVTPRVVDIVARVATADGAVTADDLTRARAAITDYLNGLRVFDRVIIAEISAALMGVDRITDAFVDQPGENLAVAFAERAVAGTVTVGAL